MKEGKKLMIVTPYFYPKIGGLENYAYNIAKGLKQKHGWEVVIVTSNHEHPSKYKEETLEGMKIYRLPRWFKVSNTPINPMWYWQIKKIIKKENPDIINGHSPVPFIADMAARVANSLKLPFVLTYHNDLVKESVILQSVISLYYSFLGNKTLSLSKRVIATSNYYAEQSKYLSIAKNKIDIVSPGTYISTKEPKWKKGEYILFVGQLDKTHRHKGLDYLIKSLGLLRKDGLNTSLKIVGKGNDAHYYQKIANEEGVSKLIDFTGYIDDKKLQEVYRNSSLVVLPSTTNSEGFGMVLIDAMSHKKPVIGSRVGGIPYVIDQGKNGLIIQQKSVLAISNAIQEILNNQKLAKKMGESGYQKVKSSFTWSIQVDRTNKLFNSSVA